MFLILQICSPMLTDPFYCCLLEALPASRKITSETGSFIWEQVWLTRLHAPEQQSLPMGRSSRCLKGKNNSQETRVEFQTAIIQKLQRCLHCRITLISVVTSYLLHIINSHILHHLCTDALPGWCSAFGYRCLQQASLILVLKIKPPLLPTSSCVSHKQ